MKAAESARAIKAMGISVETKAARVIIGPSLLESTTLKRTSKALTPVEKATLETVNEAEVAREAAASEGTRTENNDIRIKEIEQAVSEAIEYTRLEKLAAARVTKAVNHSGTQEEKSSFAAVTMADAAPSEAEEAAKLSAARAMEVLTKLSKDSPATGLGKERLRDALQGRRVANFYNI